MIGGSGGDGGVKGGKNVLSLSRLLNERARHSTISLFFIHLLFSHFLSIYLYHFNLAITKNHFKFHYVVGRGGFGKVWKIEKNKTKKLYAMKEMSKA